MTKWLIFFAVLAGSILSFEASLQASFESPQTIEVIYSGEITAIPEAAKQARIWIPLATTRDGQEVLEREIQIDIPHKIEKEEMHGNEMLFVELKAPFPEKVPFSIRYKAKTSQENFLTANQIEPVSAYLSPSRLVIIDERVKQMANEAFMTSAEPNPGRALYEYVIGHMSYDKQTPGWGKGDTSRACDVAKGNCTDFHSLFISMARAQEIPARFKIGLPLPEKGAGGKIKGYHCWAEFYEEGKGWQPVDASEAWKKPERKDLYFANYNPNNFLLSTGRDIQLNPVQAGEPVNIFFYPYMEVDGKEFNAYKLDFQYQRTQ